MPAPRTDTNNVPGHNVNSVPVDPQSPAQDDPLRAEAYRLDTQHRTLHQRPISADNLRRELGVGSRRARALAHHLRQHHQPGTLGRHHPVIRARSEDEGRNQFWIGNADANDLPECIAPARAGYVRVGRWEV